VVGPKAGGGTGENEGEQPVRQDSGSGRRACAPRSTRERDHLGALSKLAGGRFLATGERTIASQIAFGVSDRRAQWTSACLRLSM
jgi:hypothetical protein